MKLSLGMIVKNEEAVLGQCLESVRGLVDEVIIVDTGSSDKTREIAQHFVGEVGGSVVDFTWVDDFSAARNESFMKVSPNALRIVLRSPEQRACAFLLF